MTSIEELRRLFTVEDLYCRVYLISPINEGDGSELWTLRGEGKIPDYDAIWFPYYEIFPEGYVKHKKLRMKAIDELLDELKATGQIRARCNRKLKYCWEKGCPTITDDGFCLCPIQFLREKRFCVVHPYVEDTSCD